LVHFSKDETSKEEEDGNDQEFHHGEKHVEEVKLNHRRRLPARKSDPDAADI